VIKNFEEIKAQLKDLSEIINGFKSEAVQLRIVDLVFGLEDKKEVVEDEQATVKPKRKSAKRKSTKQNSEKSAVKKTTKQSGQGAVATLGKLVEEGFFDTPKSIGNVVEHCEHNLARKFKANEFSGKLGRLVREGSLTRTKNSDNQYEYQSK